MEKITIIKVEQFDYRTDMYAFRNKDEAIDFFNKTRDTWRKKKLDEGIEIIEDDQEYTINNTIHKYYNACTYEDYEIEMEMYDAELK